ncbi:MAG: SBBP repeat-containing protein [Candidatus Solibacter sp.]
MGPFGLCLRGAALVCAAAALNAAGFTTFIGDTHEYRVARVMATAAGGTVVAGSRDSGMFVMKLDAAGKITMFATLSGKGVDQVNALAVDTAGNLYLAGATTSPLLPLRSPLQATPGPGFLVKFNPDATQLLLATIFRPPFRRWQWTPRAIFMSPARLTRRTFR